MNNEELIEEFLNGNKQKLSIEDLENLYEYLEILRNKIIRQIEVKQTIKSYGA
jgi:hypothetical protein